MEPAEPCWNLFYAEARKVSGRKTIQSQHCESQFVPGWTDFFLVLFKESRFPFFGIFQAGKRSSRSITERSCAAGINFLHKQFTKHKRPISSKDLEVLYAANQLGLNAPESCVNSAWFNTIFYFGKPLRKERSWKPTRDETRWPFNSSKQQQASWSTSSRESDENSVHLQVLQVLHIPCFTDVNSETEAHFFLLKFLNSTSEYMNQKRHWTLKCSFFGQSLSRGHYQPTYQPPEQKGFIY